MDDRTHTKNCKIGVLTNLKSYVILSIVTLYDKFVATCVTKNLLCESVTTSLLPNNILFWLAQEVLMSGGSFHSKAQPNKSWRIEPMGYELIVAIRFTAKKMPAFADSNGVTEQSLMTQP